ncbi:ras-related and estrogen-regulated growth inhibitor-like isoform X1 [Petromyzon marinus]|uniref:small monomeric GTPase n=2 Tax=Petromyzon marinus TaxID=7757 RepID=A0AAJ7WP61_PETMA|nr:ras-related and estrogen-regulated growth inhibitor-like [Petromyzon marinus]
MNSSFPLPKPLKRGSGGAAGRAARLVVLGQSGVGKTAMTVRFITRRFIGEYDPTLETIYRHSTGIDGEMVQFEILDTAGQEEDNMLLEEKIKWGEGFLIAYSVTDRCSFDEVMRLRFLVNHAHACGRRGPSAADPPPALVVANKRDLQFDRMVSVAEGEALAAALRCPFAEVSARDSYEEVLAAFEALHREMLRQSGGSPGAHKRKMSSKIMDRMPRFPASPSVNGTGRTFTFSSN